MMVTFSYAVVGFTDYVEIYLVVQDTPNKGPPYFTSSLQD